MSRRGPAAHACRACAGSWTAPVVRRPSGAPVGDPRVAAVAVRRAGASFWRKSRGNGVRAPRRVGRFAMIADALPTARRVAGERGPAGADRIPRLPRAHSSMTTPSQQPPPASRPTRRPHAVGDERGHFPVADRRARARRASRARRGARGRRHGGRNRSVAGRRTERHRAQGRSRDDRVQPRQGHRRHRLHRAAPRPREHRRFLRRRDRATVAKALAIARYTARGSVRRVSPIPIGSRARFPISISITRGTCRSTTRSRWGAKPKRRRSPSTAGSPTPKARRVARGESEFVYANTHGFSGGYRSSRHHIDCAVIGEPATARCSATTGTRPRARRGDLDPARDVGPHRRRAHGAAARRAAARARIECPVLFEAPEAARPDRLLRRRGVRRQPLPQVVVPARFARAAGVRAARHRSARSRICCAAAAARRSTTKASRRSRATSSRDGVRARLFPRQLLGAQARPRDDRQRRRQPQPRRRPRRRRSRRRCCDGWAAACSSPSSWGRASIRSPATSRAARRASGSRTARSPIRSRRSRSPAT